MGINIELLKKMVEDYFSTDSSGHDYYHAVRVMRLARYIAEQEGGDLLLVQVAGLVHDVFDWKFEAKGRQEIDDFLLKNMSNAHYQKLKKIVQSISYKGAKVEETPLDLEGQIVRDADRLDAIGALGVARAFAYGGHKGQKMYDPKITPCLHGSFKEYASSESTSLNHFYEKLFLLKDRMHTATARHLAKSRHRFMEQFVEQFMSEWNLLEIDIDDEVAVESAF